MELTEPRYVLVDGRLKRVVEVLQDAELNQLETRVNEDQLRYDQAVQAAETAKDAVVEAERALNASKRDLDVAKTVVGDPDDESEQDGVGGEVADQESQPEPAVQF